MHCSAVAPLQVFLLSALSNKKTVHRKMKMLLDLRPLSVNEPLSLF